MAWCCRRNDGQALRHIKTNDPAANAHFGDNAISNRKYSWLGFLPMNLLEQFSRPMNAYFLLIACLQLNSEITPVDPLTTWGPLVIIFGITVIKELVDELARARADKEANTREYTVCRDGAEVVVASADIRAGDILKLAEDEEVPADCVLLSSSDESGNCFVQTTNLDGESNLKGRASLAQTKGVQSAADAGQFRAEVRAPAVDADLGTFDAQLRLGAAGSRASGAALPLTANNLLLQATHLRNTAWVLAVVVYTGNETKFGMNKSRPPPKYTRADDAINAFSLIIFSFQLVLTVVFGIVGNWWKANWGLDMWFLEYPADEASWRIIIIPARFLLLNSTMIPISLKVTLDLCKIYYGKFIDGDLKLYVPETGIRAIANTTNLAEDLGQVEYVLTDKTGTLTQNVMVLKSLCVQGTLYGEGADHSGSAPPSRSSASPLTPAGLSISTSTAAATAAAAAAAAATTLAGHQNGLHTPGANGPGDAFVVKNESSPTGAPPRQAPTPATPGWALPPELCSMAEPVDRWLEDRIRREVHGEHRSGEGSASSQAALELLRCIALNNDVRPAAPKDQSRASRRIVGFVEYKGSSPDEEAFVKSAFGLDVKLVSREGGVDEQQVRLRECGATREYRQLVVFPFDSDRKRMSVLVELPNGSKRLYSKGADDKLMTRMSTARGVNPSLQRTQDLVDGWAAEGLRTLVFAYRDLTEAEYAAWRRDVYQPAARALQNRKAALGQAFARLECDFVLLGATAVEDKLQDRVPETIAQLRQANIRFWMCTGDKMSTARTIATTCRLLPRDPGTGEVIPPIRIEGDAEEVVQKIRDLVQRLKHTGYDLRPLPPKRSWLSSVLRSAAVGSLGVGAPVDAPTPDLGRPAAAAGRTPLADQLHEAPARQMPAASSGAKGAAAAPAAGKRRKPRRSSYAVEMSSRTRPGLLQSKVADTRPQIVGGTGVDDRLRRQSRRQSAYRLGKQPFSIIIDGQAVGHAMSGAREELAEVCLAAQSVVCCRVTPLQKKQLVELAREAGHQALAIGDGGNDVGMIQAAHVGIGIRGKEGLQAARASDYQVADFKSLERLLLVHGRYAYYRTCLVAQYSFYKSFLFCFIQIGFGFWSGFAGVSFFNSLCVAAYNAILFVPIVFFMTDKDIEQRTATRHPIAYRQCNENHFMNYWTMLLWLLRAFVQAYLIVACLMPSLPHSWGSSHYEVSGLILFNAYMLVQDFTMLLELHRWTSYNVISIFGMHVIAIVVGLMANNTTSMENFIDTGALNTALSDPLFYLEAVLLAAVTILPVETLRLWHTASSTGFSAGLRRLDRKLIDSGFVDASGELMPEGWWEDDHLVMQYPSTRTRRAHAAGAPHELLSPLARSQAQTNPVAASRR